MKISRTGYNGVRRTPAQRLNRARLAVSLRDKQGLTFRQLAEILDVCPSRAQQFYWRSRWQLEDYDRWQQACEIARTLPPHWAEARRAS